MPDIDKLIHKIYDAFNARDIDTALSTFHPQIEWPKAFEGGYVTGPEEIRSYWTRQWTEIDPHVEPIAVANRDEHVIEVTVHQTVKDLGGTTIFNGIVKHVYVLADELFRRMDIELPSTNFREATDADIPQIQRVRNAVTENRLSDPSLVTDADCSHFINNRGKGWVCEIDHTIVGFAIADLEDENIWALFVDPAFVGTGIGKTLHDMMLDWYFDHKDYVWLGTAPETRAAEFYPRNGWQRSGMHGKELKFEMRRSDWTARRNVKQII